MKIHITFTIVSTFCLCLIGAGFSPFDVTTEAGFACINGLIGLILAAYLENDDE